jgi:hypothetical protein
MLSLTSVSKNFLMSQKHASVHPLIYEYQAREDEEKLLEGSLVKTIAMGWTEDNIETEASTRMLKVDQIIQHFWDGNPTAIVFNEDGTVKQNASLPAPLACDEPRKFLVYVSYRVHRDLFSQVALKLLSNSGVTLTTVSCRCLGLWVVSTSATMDRWTASGGKRLWSGSPTTPHAAS